MTILYIEIIVWWLYNQGKSNTTWEFRISEIDLEQKHGVNESKEAAWKISAFELRKVCLANSRVPVVHCDPLHPRAHVQVFGAVQVPPFWQVLAHTAVQANKKYHNIKNRDAKTKAYSALIHPILEYSTPVCPPYEWQHFNALKKVQRWVARRASGARWNRQHHCCSSPYPESCHELQWLTLQQRHFLPCQCQTEYTEWRGPERVWSE